ncbi:MAG: endolytic transglycosylase MltG [Catalinimonas sp.]
MSKSVRRLLIAFVAFSVLVVSFSFYGYQVLFTPNVLVEQEERVLYVPPGATYRDVLDTLQRARFIQDPLSFSFVAKVAGYQDNVKPGAYLLKPDMTNKEAVWLLRSGAQTPVELTFNNVRLRRDLARKLSNYVVADSTEILRMLRDPAVAKRYGFDTTNFVGMFLPNTYEVYWTTTAEQLFDRMHQEWERYWNEARRAQAAAHGLTPQEVTTLAAIVQEETNKADEMPRVAGVYLNRLRDGWPLQADPTLKYAVGDFTIKRVLNVHKEVDSPYNTYMYPGLPPGPISLPSTRAIGAVLNAETHNYMYFCARADFSGYHAFAKTLHEHNRNAAVYQRALTAAGY